MSIYLATNEVKPYVSVSDRHESQESERLQPLSARLGGIARGQQTNLQCLEGHTIRHFAQGYRKLRKDGKGRVSQPNRSSFTCRSCRQQIILSQQGYYSCNEFCDFDLCTACVTCSIDGNLLYETYEAPSEDTLKWQEFCQQTTQDDYFEEEDSANSPTEINQKQVKMLEARCCRCSRTMEV